MCQTVAAGIIRLRVGFQGGVQRLNDEREVPQREAERVFDVPGHVVHAEAAGRVLALQPLQGQALLADVLD